MRTGLVLCFVYWSLYAEAQISLGLKGGLNLSDVVINNATNNPDAESDFRMKAGMHGGFFGLADIGMRTSLGVELLYSNKGVNAITNINLHYISLPVLIRYSLSEKFVAEGGPELSYLVAAKSKYGNVSNVWNNSLDLGLDLGIAYLISPRLSANMRFNAGISSVIRNADSTGGKLRYQNRVLQLSLAYALKKIELKD